MKMKRIDSTRGIIHEKKDSIFGYFAWPSVARLQDGTLAVTASGFRISHVCPFGKAVIFYSRDEGKSWSEPSVIIDTPLDDRDTGIFAYGKSDVIVTSFNNKLASQRRYAAEHYRGTDKALVEAYIDAAEQLGLEEKYFASTYRISNDCAHTFGELKTIPITNPHGPCMLPDGRLIYIGRPFFTFDDESRRYEPLQCYVQNEKGEFEYRSSIEPIEDKEGPITSSEPHAVVLPSGKIIVHIRVERSHDAVFTIYQCESNDRGKTFTKPHSLGIEHGSPPHLLRHSSGVLISSYSYRKSPPGQRVMLSRDEGESWQTDYVLCDDGPSWDLGYPATAELNDGSLITVYYQQRAKGEKCSLMQSIWRLPQF